jgi:hypothetical protein
VRKRMTHKRLLRTLLLPVELELESVCINEMVSFFAPVVGDDIGDQTVWLDGRVNDWDETGTASPELKTLIERLLLSGIKDYSEGISANYFSAHAELVANQLFPSELARSFLSHLLLITRLRMEERMSCAQISKILHSMNPSAGFGRRSVAAILKKMGIAPSVTLEDISTLFEADKDLTPVLFGDASLSECSLTLTSVAHSLGFKENCGNHLASLFHEDEVAKFAAYAQILHYQCSILEYYDHNVKDFYEFSPRGNAALYLFKKYPNAMSVAGNPFLNNAKSVAQITFSWVAAKKGREFIGANALFSIIDGLDEMGYAARQELALWLRCFIHRFMVLAEPLGIPLSDITLDDSSTRLMTNIGNGNTSTRGIIEQRLVDALASLKHLESDGWVGRGLGDHVNTTNLSKKKLGDCDFQNIEDKVVFAYEAHGGLLTQTYLDEHLRTLKKSAQPRIDEWKTFSNASDWHVNVLFVAHENNAIVPEDTYIDGVRFSIVFMSYHDLIGQTNQLAIGDALNEYLLEPLSLNNTPSFVRQVFVDLLV